MADFWVIVLSSALVIAAWSILYRNNVFYKITSALVLSWLVGYSSIEVLKVLYNRVWTPLFVQGEWWNPVLIATVLGLMYWLRPIRKAAWLSRWPIALIAGTMIAVSISGSLYADLISLVTMGSFTDLTPSSAGGLVGINNIIVAVIIITGTMYFIFTHEHRGPIGVLAKIGKYFLMVTFGWISGTFFMSLTAFSIADMVVLMEMPSLYVSAAAVVLLLADIVYRNMRGK